MEILENSYKYKLKSQVRRPAKLWGGGNLKGRQFSLNSIVEIEYHVKNHGQQFARSLEMFFIPSGPFVRAPKEKCKFKKITTYCMSISSKIPYIVVYYQKTSFFAKFSRFPGSDIDINVR